MGRVYLLGINIGLFLFALAWTSCASKQSVSPVSSKKSLPQEGFGQLAERQEVGHRSAFSSTLFKNDPDLLSSYQRLVNELAAKPTDSQLEELYTRWLSGAGFKPGYQFRKDYLPWLKRWVEDLSQETRLLPRMAAQRAHQKVKIPSSQKLLVRVTNPQFFTFPSDSNPSVYKISIHKASNLHSKQLHPKLPSPPISDASLTVERAGSPTSDSVQVVLRKFNRESGGVVKAWNHALIQGSLEVKLPVLSRGLYSIEVKNQYSSYEYFFSHSPISFQEGVEKDFLWLRFHGATLPLSGKLEWEGFNGVNFTTDSAGFSRIPIPDGADKYQVGVRTQDDLFVSSGRIQKHSGGIRCQEILDAPDYFPLSSSIHIYGLLEKNKNRDTLQWFIQGRLGLRRTGRTLPDSNGVFQIELLAPHFLPADEYNWGLQDKNGQGLTCSLNQPQHFSLGLQNPSQELIVSNKEKHRLELQAGSAWPESHYGDTLSLHIYKQTLPSYHQNYGSSQYPPFGPDSFFLESTLFWDSLGRTSLALNAIEAQLNKSSAGNPTLWQILPQKPWSSEQTSQLMYIGADNTTPWIGLSDSVQVVGNTVKGWLINQNSLPGYLLWLKPGKVDTLSTQPSWKGSIFSVFCDQAGEYKVEYRNTQNQLLSTSPVFTCQSELPRKEALSGPFFPDSLQTPYFLVKGGPGYFVHTPPAQNWKSYRLKTALDTLRLPPSQLASVEGWLFQDSHNRPIKLTPPLPQNPAAPVLESPVTPGLPLKIYWKNAGAQSIREFWWEKVARVNPSSLSGTNTSESNQEIWKTRNHQNHLLTWFLRGRQERIMPADSWNMDVEPYQDEWRPPLRYGYQVFSGYTPNDSMQILSPPEEGQWSLVSIWREKKIRGQYVQEVTVKSPAIAPYQDLPNWLRSGDEVSVLSTAQQNPSIQFIPDSLYQAYRYGISTQAQDSIAILSSSPHSSPHFSPHSSPHSSPHFSPHFSPHKSKLSTLAPGKYWVARTPAEVSLKPLIVESGLKNYSPLYTLWAPSKKQLYYQLPPPLGSEREGVAPLNLYISANPYALLKAYWGEAYPEDRHTPLGLALEHLLEVSSCQNAPCPSLLSKLHTLLQMLIDLQSPGGGWGRGYQAITDVSETLLILDLLNHARRLGYPSSLTPQLDSLRKNINSRITQNERPSSVLMHMYSYQVTGRMAGLREEQIWKTQFRHSQLAQSLWRSLRQDTIFDTYPPLDSISLKAGKEALFSGDAQESFFQSSLSAAALHLRSGRTLSDSLRLAHLAYIQRRAGLRAGLSVNERAWLILALLNSGAFPHEVLSGQFKVFVMGSKYIEFNNDTLSRNLVQVELRAPWERLLFGVEKEKQPLYVFAQHPQGWKEDDLEEIEPLRFFQAQFHKLSVKRLEAGEKVYTLQEAGSQKVGENLLLRWEWEGRQSDKIYRISLPKPAGMLEQGWYPLRIENTTCQAAAPEFIWENKDRRVYLVKSQDGRQCIDLVVKAQYAGAYIASVGQLVKEETGLLVKQTQLGPYIIGAAQQ